MLEDIKNYFANFDDATDSCRTVALWITIAMLVAFIAAKVYILILGKKSRRFDKQTVETANHIVNGAWITSALVIAAAFIIAFAVCYFIDDAIVPILFYPLLVLATAIVASAIAIFVKPTKICKIACAAVSGCALIAVLICMIVYYSSGKAGENNYGTDVLSNVGLYVSAVIVTLGVVAFAFLADRKKRPFDTRIITFAAVCVALSFALSYVRLFKMPMGGSITFASMLPLMLFAFIFGSRKGVLVGLVYGVLQAIQDPWIIHPAQFVLDYLVAFASIGLTGCIRELGLFKNNMRAQFALGASIACLFRFVCHYFAGVFAFGVYGAGFAADYGMPMLANEYFYSFVYQCMYLIPELAIVIVVGMLVFASGNFRKQIQTYVNKYGAKKEVAVQLDVAQTDEDIEPTATDVARSANE